MNLAVNDIWMATVYCHLEQQIGINNSFFQVGPPFGGGGTAQDLADAVDNAVRPFYLPLLSGNAEYRGVTVCRVHQLPRTAPVKCTLGPVAGSGGAGGLPKQVSGVISKHTEFAGKRFRGRMYIPFPSPDMSQAGGQPTAAYVANLATLAGAWTTIHSAGPIANNSPVTIGLWDPLKFVFTPITTMTAKSIFGTQRRRGDYGRANISPI